MGSDSVPSETTTESASTLTDRLAKLGLGPTELTNIISLLEAARSEQGSTDTAPPQGQQLVSAKGTIKLYLAEEQQILREAYHSFFSSQSTVSIAGTSRRHLHRISRRSSYDARSGCYAHRRKDLAT